MLYIGYAVIVRKQVADMRIMNRSQIRIATREFHFVLPPPSAPEDSPSPISPASTTRHLSPSIDITSLSPDSSVHSPTATHADIPPLPDEPKEPSKSARPQAKAGCKKRKKSGESRPPPPEVMPPRPAFTYAQLCYRAITALDGKATLQEICSWVSDNFDWYHYNEGTGWEVSDNQMLLNFALNHHVEFHTS